MAHYPPIDLIDTISRKYPGMNVSCIGDSHTYANINWGDNTPVSEAQLIADKLIVYRAMIIEQLREDAKAQRISKMMLVLGTNDQEQIRTYEEKFIEAQNWTANNSAPTPIMTGEVSYTGETVAALAPRVIAEFVYAKGVLQSMYGAIEGQRRAAITAINAMTLSELEAYTGPVGW